MSHALMRLSRLELAQLHYLSHDCSCINVISVLSSTQNVKYEITVMGQVMQLS